MNIKTLEIKEDTKYLESILRKQRESRYYKRIQVLYLLKTKQFKSLYKIGKFLSVDRQTVSRWLNLYVNEGIERLLMIKTHSNMKRVMPQNVFEEVKKKLNDTKGFSSYKEIQTWIDKEFGLKMIYKTVHKTVRYAMGAKLKVPRKSHIKKDPEAFETYKKTLIHI